MSLPTEPRIEKILPSIRENGGILGVGSRRCSIVVFVSTQSVRDRRSTDHAKARKPRYGGLTDRRPAVGSK
ncbi:hypothetical protein LC1Hm_0817 [Halomicrobium sp. LC1Hm]|nr:hypothetical protein LC1Hm_0817 [Halomicrobium sp. LC1Hm]